METLIIDPAVVWSPIRRHLKTIVFSAIVFGIIAGCVSFSVFKEKYQSQATLLFNPTKVSKVVTSADIVNRFLEGHSQDASPFKNQEALLKSRVLGEKVFAALQKKDTTLPASSPEQLMKKVFSAKHVRGTDFIQINAIAPHPLQAKALLTTYMETYKKLVSNISNAPFLQKEHALQKEVLKAEEALNTLNNEIQAYQEEFSIVDIASESQLKVNTFAKIKRQIEETEAKIMERQGEIDKIRNQLNLKDTNTASVIQSVAGGQDQVLMGLQQKLQKTEQEYKVKSLIYAPTNPEMEKLAEKIAVLRGQVGQEQSINIGFQGGTHPAFIRDRLRSGLVHRLATAEGDYAALQKRLRTMQQQAHILETQLQKLPSQQLAYARLKLEAQNKENILTRLREKLAEVKIQSATAEGRLFVVDPPSTPSLPIFPTHWHWIGIGALFGGCLAMVCAVGLSLRQAKELDPQMVELGLKVPVLGLLPWFANAPSTSRKKSSTKASGSYIVPSGVRQPYHELALSLNVHRKTEGKNCLVVSSLLQEAEKPTILLNLAYCLAQSGNRVVLVDTNLQNPGLHKVFNHALNYDKSIIEAINGISETLFHQGNNNAEQLSKTVAQSLQSTNESKNLYYLNTGVSIDNTFEFLNTKGFTALLETLKKEFDWVLLDAPPFLMSSDAAVVLQNSDGLVLLVERDGTLRQLQEVQQKVQKLQGHMVGCVLRQFSNL